MPNSLKRMAAVGAAGWLLVEAVTMHPAMAQARKPAAPAPNTQQQAQQAPQAPQQPQGPVRLDLVATQMEWTKVCGRDPASGKEVCYTTRDFGSQADQPPVLALAVYDVKGEDARVVRLLMPVGLLLRPGLRFSVDKSPTIEGSFELCFPNGCFAEAKVKGATIDQMRKGNSFNVAVKNQVNNEVTFVVPLAGFGKAFDGPPIDPKVLEEQQKKLQAELQKRAEEERKRLEASQQKPGAPNATPPATPAPAPAGK
ncbi:invasion associated locus B family protein [Beijerinckia mobilis]|uniref:invasion associated locus B family protein n=1 Tax=Beijerinckia mobilis TaxID=231434 RepID=UPI00055094E3|nr:invasion associated locus B family protein [Beijerinckia mobilis]